LSSVPSSSRSRNAIPRAGLEFAPYPRFRAPAQPRSAPSRSSSGIALRPSRTPTHRRHRSAPRRAPRPRDFAQGRGICRNPQTSASPSGSGRFWSRAWRRRSRTLTRVAPCGSSSPAGSTAAIGNFKTASMLAGSSAGSPCRAHLNRKVSEAQKAANTTRSKVRARVEHVFGDQKNGMGNMRRFVCLESMTAAAG
jgi:hypothetical protein